MDKEREVFDDWYGIKPKGWFEAIKYNTAWKAWQATKAQAVPDGFVLVPKEPTDKTIARMINTPIEVNLLCDHADTFLSEGEAYIAYQAMIEAQGQK